MITFTTAMYISLFFFITVTEGGKKSSMDKIIIHVPYKIYKHHHTHTKYKVITIPVPKKENTVIYLKEDIQPNIPPVSAVQIPSDMSEGHQKTPEQFIPPHQQSAFALLEDMLAHKDVSWTQRNQQQQYKTIAKDQKPLESHLGQTSKGFTPSFTFKPVTVPPHENLIPNFSSKPVLHPSQHFFTPKLLLNPIIHQFYESLPKFTYHPILHQTQGHFNPNYTFKIMLPHPKELQDSIAHTSNQVNQTIFSKPKTKTSYKVTEETTADHDVLLNKHQSINLNRIPVPFMISNKGKPDPPIQKYVNNQLKHTRNVMQADSDYEYEHVGYLIIDGNSRKVVGKNFKDNILLTT